MAARERPFPLHAGIATVAAVRPLGGAMLRLTLHAPAFADPGIEQPGEVLTLGWAPAGERLALPRDGWRFPAGRGEQHWRNFTVRRFDPARATVDIDFFLHGDGGIAAAWAARAAPGDEVGFAGPRAHWEPDPGARWSLLVADETGLPALLSILESLPAGHRAIAIAEVASDGAALAPAACAATIELHPAPRDGLPPGTTTALIDTLRALALPRAPGQAWGGGEAGAMRDVRSHLLAERPQLKRAMRIRGYWKHRGTPAGVD